MTKSYLVDNAEQHPQLTLLNAGPSKVRFSFFVPKILGMPDKVKIMQTSERKGNITRRTRGV